MLQVDRTGTKVTVVEQKERKDYTFQANIMELVVDCIEKGVVPNPEVLFSTTKGRKMNTNVGLHHLPTHLPTHHHHTNFKEGKIWGVT